MNVSGDVVCSNCGAIYDVFGYVHPILVDPHDGMKFSTWDMDYDTSTSNCAALNSGGFWFNKCGVTFPTVDGPAWFCRDDATYPEMKNIHMMVKLH